MGRPDIMLDMETLGVGNSPVVLSIGAVSFRRNGNLDNESELRHIFHTYLDPGPQVERGLVITPSTALWWMNQGKEARAQFNRVSVEHPEKALRRFSAWVKQTDGKNLWSYGATADIVWLESLYRAFGIYETEFPFSYRELRCFRTLTAENPEVPKPERSGIAHNALDDAMTQARWAQRIFNQQ